MTRIKILIFVLSILTICSKKVLAQDDYKFEQMALDYLLNNISKKDSSMLGLKIITAGKTSSLKTQYRDICEDLEVQFKDSLFMKGYNKEHHPDYWKHYDHLPIVQLKVPSTNKMPEKIKKNIKESKTILEIRSVSHKLKFRNNYYITIDTRFLHDEQGLSIKLKMNKEGKVEKYRVSPWIG